MYKIVFLDYSMPDMDGPQVCKELRNILNKELIEIPYICCVSAYTEASFQIQAMAAGMSHFLTKPVSQNELLSVCSILSWWFTNTSFKNFLSTSSIPFNSFLKYFNFKNFL